MIMVPAGVKVWQATGYTDMRKGFPGLSLILQKALKLTRCVSTVRIIRSWRPTTDILHTNIVSRRSPTAVKAFERKRPSRKLFPVHLPRERVVIATPTNCACCESAKLS
ncbi:hypothetical protein CFBP5877_28180 (plasmid) [Agrobacterium tumefaciens]|uniref:Transposase n=2 Tax=Agrobacterium tumefaciens complex TaxID=1183400 RepID=A0AAE6EIR5_AGRTU|nr:hypothetical protein [Agrobacterium genomosp. 6]QCL77498.1 hypothetical protein CFBP5499_29015 [Agrobacterium tumefaciens]ASK40701.1 hypothetical protein [Agrobacterium genomosp. 6]ASK40878.1 hypothetical protein [Agrobacterium genomosp. 6]ASK41464.1 hypothetical protein [Agrobacterium genomosp. 6]QCL82986.1 hypothetical protein CFBP5877_28180 [Agrobacterium tumefaciens]